MREPYLRSREEVLKTFIGESPSLSQEEIEKRQKEYGPNEIAGSKKKSKLQIFLEQFKDFLVIILIVAAFVSGFLGDIESTIVILVVITMNAILGTIQTVKAEQSLDSLKDMEPHMAKVLRGGQFILVPAKEITVGDQVALEAGDQIPADGRILESASLKVDESPLTGESVSVEKEDANFDQEVPLADRKNMIHSGTFVSYGRGTFLVTAIGMNTEVGKIAGLLESASNRKTPLQVSLDDFGKKLSILILVFCGILFGLNVAQGKEVGEAFLFAVALAVAAIPEALSSIVTIVLAWGTRKMAEEGAIVRKLQAVEGLGSVSIICSDKTGTLTQNKMTVEHCFFNGESYTIDNSFQEEGRDLLMQSVLCSDATVTKEDEIGDPTETALVVALQKMGMSWEELRNCQPRISEVPFDSDRKLMSTLHSRDDENYMITKGATDVLLERISYIRNHGEIEKVTLEWLEKIKKQNQEYSSSGLRVLAVAYKEVKKQETISVEDENEYVFLGLIAMMDPPRVESEKAVQDCISAGMKPVMITGDHKVTAAAIAKRIGILNDISEACEGAEIDDLSDEQLEDFVEHVSVYARVSPEHKIRIVKAWQNKGKIVAMTGDGVNDAPALKQADIGIAMGITGTEVSKDASSMILTDDNFATIIKAVENGRNIYENIKHAIQFLLSGNFGGILAVLYAAIFALPVPFSPVHLLFINLLTDSLPAVALGLEPHKQEVMLKKPRKKDEGILTKDFLIRVGIQGVVIAVLTMIAFYIGFVEGDATLGRTMAFGTLCLARLVHGYNSKSNDPVIFQKGFFNNKYLQGAFMMGFVLLTAVVTIPALQPVFKVTSLSFVQLFTIYGLALLNLPIVQGIKWGMKKK